MKRYSTMMSVLLTLALPVAAMSADAPAAPEKSHHSMESIKDSMSKKGRYMGMDMNAPAGGGAEVNPSGKVVETMNGGGYTYANLEKAGKKTWVAFPTLETRVGETLTFKGCTEMNGFQSKALNRTFDSILFCGPPEVGTAAKSTAAKKSPGSEGASVAGKKIAVEKATGPNAYTVAEIFAKRAALNGKQVVVRGQVVKASSGIMNKNWLHLQDGTGDKKTNDLVVTTKDTAEIGDVVTVSGTVVKDKDFGSGYKYGVMIENGRVKK